MAEDPPGEHVCIRGVSQSVGQRVTDCQEFRVSSDPAPADTFGVETTINSGDKGYMAIISSVNSHIVLCNLSVGFSFPLKLSPLRGQSGHRQERIALNVGQD